MILFRQGRVPKMRLVYVDDTVEIQKNIKKKGWYYELLEEIVFDWKGMRFRIPVGFVWDGASSPQWLPKWLCPNGSIIPSCIHDYGYNHPLLPEWFQYPEMEKVLWDEMYHDALLNFKVRPVVAGLHNLILISAPSSHRYYKTVRRLAK